MSDVIFPAQGLERFVRDVLVAAGAHLEAADAAGRVLVAADLRGHESHGVARLPAYVAQLEAGTVDGQARPSVVTEHGATALVDARNGLGHLAGEMAMDHAIGLARQHGSAVVAVTESNHYGIAAHYVERAANEGMLAISTTNTGASVAAAGSSRPFFGTNPLAIAAPALEEPHLVFDMATSVVAGGKFEVAIRKGESIPEGWGIDAEGRHTTEPGQVFGAGGVLLPLASRSHLSAHKGFGLGLLVEMLSAVLAGGPVGPGVGNLTFASSGIPSRVSASFIAISPEAFGGEAALRGRVTALRDALTALPSLDAEDPVRTPGARSYRCRIERERDGIPVPRVVADSLRAVGDRHGITSPILTS